MGKHMFSNKALWKLMAPLAFDQLLNSMMGTVGTMVVSNLGSAAISAVSLVDAINVLIVQAFYALAAGGTVVCSQYLGCKKEKEANEAARQLLFITFVLSVVIAAICLAANGPLLRLIFRRSRTTGYEIFQTIFYYFGDILSVYCVV